MTTNDDSTLDTTPETQEGKSTFCIHEGEPSNVTSVDQYPLGFPPEDGK